MNKTPLTLVAFGDSITQAVEVPESQRWPQLLEDALTREIVGREIKIINRGVGGNTSREGLARIEEVLDCAPHFVLVEFGNDATHQMDRHVSLDEFAANFDEMRRRFAAIGAVMIPMTFPPIIDEWHADNLLPFHQQYGGGDAHQELYRQQTRAFSAEHDLHLIETDLALRAARDADGAAKYFQPDGVHLTRDGNALFCETVLKNLLASGVVK